MPHFKWKIWRQTVIGTLFLLNWAQLAQFLANKFDDSTFTILMVAWILAGIGLGLFIRNTSLFLSHVSACVALVFLYWVLPSNVTDSNENGFSFIAALMSIIGIIASYVTAYVVDLMTRNFKGAPFYKSVESKYSYAVIVTLGVFPIVSIYSVHPIEGYKREAHEEKQREIDETNGRVFRDVLSSFQMAVIQRWPDDDARLSQYRRGKSEIINPVGGTIRFSIKANGGDIEFHNLPLSIACSELQNPDMREVYVQRGNASVLVWQTLLFKPHKVNSQAEPCRAKNPGVADVTILLETKPKVIHLPVVKEQRFPDWVPSDELIYGHYEFKASNQKYVIDIKSLIEASGEPRIKAFRDRCNPNVIENDCKNRTKDDIVACLFYAFAHTETVRQLSVFQETNPKLQALVNGVPVQVWYTTCGDEI